MKGDIPAAIALHDLNAKLLQLLIGGKQIPIHPRPTAKGNHRRMLDQEQTFLLSFQHALMHALLVFPRRVVGNLP